MRGFVLVLFASIPLFGGSADISVTCDGVSVVGSGTASFKPVWSRIVAPRLVRLAGQPPAVTRDHWHLLVSR
jgi:hypothetical protein